MRSGPFEFTATPSSAAARRRLRSERAPAGFLRFTEALACESLAGPQKDFPAAVPQLTLGLFLLDVLTEAPNHPKHSQKFISICTSKKRQKSAGKPGSNPRKRTASPRGADPRHPRMLLAVRQLGGRAREPVPSPETDRQHQNRYYPQYMCHSLFKSQPAVLLWRLVGPSFSTLSEQGRSLWE